MLETSKLYLAQEDGGLATTLAAGSAPGESGVSVLSVRFHRGAHLCAALRRHLICLCRRCALREIARDPYYRCKAFLSPETPL